VGSVDDEENWIHQQIEHHGKQVRGLALAVILLGVGMICGNLGNIAMAVDRIF